MNQTNVKGTLEKIRFTSGALGEQYVTIAGIEYITFWDISCLKKDRIVEIETSSPPECYIGSSKVVFKNLQAKFVRFCD